MSASLIAAALALAPASFADHQAACAGKDGWSDPAPPVRIFANVYNVGTCGIVVLLVTGRDGHILIDGATERAAPAIARNIVRAGFRLRDVKTILASHEHVDHVGGLATLQRLTGATIRLSPVAAGVLSSGRLDPSDPQNGAIANSPVARTGRALRDGEVVRVGPLRLTAHFTPGHAPGGTSWTWRSCAGADCRTVAFADSISAVSADGFRFRDHPERVAALRRSFATVAALPCDLLITPHPAASKLYERQAGKAPLIDAGACAAYVAAASQALDARLAKEATP